MSIGKQISNVWLGHCSNVGIYIYLQILLKFIGYFIVVWHILYYISFITVKRM